jgi:putative sigma-54 modulation protein
MKIYSRREGGYMRIDIRGIHVDVTDKIRDYFDKKMHKLDFARDMIIDLLVTISKEKSNFKIDATINFRWGNTAHISSDSFDVFEGIDSFIDKLETKVTKEKEKIQQH